jgi:hypothetical protein
MTVMMTAGVRVRGCFRHVPIVLWLWTGQFFLMLKKGRFLNTDSRLERFDLSRAAEFFLLPGDESRGAARRTQRAPAPPSAPDREF